MWGPRGTQGSFLASSPHYFSSSFSSQPFPCTSCHPCRPGYPQAKWEAKPWIRIRTCEKSPKRVQSRAPQRKVTCPRPHHQIYRASLAGYLCVELGGQGAEGWVTLCWHLFPLGETAPHPNPPRGSLLPNFTSSLPQGPRQPARPSRSPKTGHWLAWLG